MKEERLRLFNKNILTLTLLFLFVFGCFSYASDDIQIKAFVDKNSLKQDDTLILSVDITGDISSTPKINLPDLNEGFDILSTSQSQNISLMGKESKLVVKFKYVLLPKRQGKITIDSIEADYKDEVYKTDPIEIEVLAPAKPIVPKTPEEEGIPLPEGEGEII